MSNISETKSNKPTAAENLMQLMSFTADKALELADANSVLGEKIEIDGMTIIPVSKISAGFAGGGASVINATVKKSNTPAGSGAKVSVTPISFLVIANGEVNVVEVASSGKDTKSSIIDAVIKQFKKNKKDSEEK